MFDRFCSEAGVEGVEVSEIPTFIVDDSLSRQSFTASIQD